MVVNHNPEYFLTIAQEQSISRAAEKLYISQSSLSQHLAKLESGLEAKLFDRSTNPIRLTEAGRIYQEYLESDRYLYQKLQSDLQEQNRSRSQRVGVGLGTWRGSNLLPEILPPFLTQHPRARVDLREFPVSELFTMTLSEAVDFSIMNTPVAGLPDSLVQEIIVYERILLVLNRDNPVAQDYLMCRESGVPYDLQRLQSVRHISLNPNLSVGSHVSNFFSRNRLAFSDCLYTTNNSTVLSLVAKGFGFCFLVESGLNDAHAHPELVAFDLKSQSLMLPLSLIYKKNSYVSPLAQDMMELIRSFYLRLIETQQKLLL